MGMKYAEILCRESRWSKATYTYQKATFLMMCEQTDESEAHLKFLMGWDALCFHLDGLRLSMGEMWHKFPVLEFWNEVQGDVYIFGVEPPWF